MGDVEITSKNLKSIQVGDLNAKFSADGTRILRYYIDFRHTVLHLHKELSAPELTLLQNKIDNLMAQWDGRMIDYYRRTKISDGKNEAEQMTIDAEANLASLSCILQHTLDVDDRVNWDNLKDFRRYNDQSFDRPPPQHQKRPKPAYSPPDITFWDKLLGRRGSKIEQSESAHAILLAQWHASAERAEINFRQQLAEWTAEKVSFEAITEAAKTLFLETQAETNLKVDKLAAGVADGSTQSVIEHASIVLERSNYNELFEKSFDIDYEPTSKTLLVEYELPSPDEMPKIKSVKFSAATGELKETTISERDQKANFDSACYQICLRTLHELFEADEFENIERILFNGITSYVDKATGRDTTACIMSILVDRSEFLEIDLRRIDPKACFKSLKGVSASTLSALAPIPPVMELNKQDRRFIDPRATAVDYSTNLAAMDWEDFEHLVREVFEREFLSRGGEVKITRSSSDGGVDAVAFDPDPITGGKIVIQAKRYTRTVGVSAVRDLYGTMQHEGASRGILVTTADYGPDAHKFSAGKSMTLMTGANLLHLMGKHGIAARIDIQEARQFLKAQSD